MERKEESNPNMVKTSISITDVHLRTILQHSTLFCQEGCVKHGRHAIKLTIDPFNHDPWIILFCCGAYKSSLNIKTGFNTLNNKKIDLTPYPLLVDTFNDIAELIATRFGELKSKIDTQIANNESTTSETVTSEVESDAADDRT